MATIEQFAFVRDREETRRMRPADDWTEMSLLASLSADPSTIAELERAWLRYRGAESGSHLEPASLPETEPSGPWLLIDLARRRISAGGGCWVPRSPACYEREESEPAPERVWIHYPPGWKCVDESTWQQAVAAPGPRREPLDVRGVLFGRPLAEGLASRALQAAREGALPELPPGGDPDAPLSEAQIDANNRWYDLTVRVHADWLLSTRDDLEGRTPRQFLHAGREWVSKELAHRQQQWNLEGQAPPPLDRASMAYRYGPLGHVEVVMYFEICRHVIGEAWQTLADQPFITLDELTKQLHQVTKRYMAEGVLEGDAITIGQIIEMERQRTPITTREGIDPESPEYQELLEIEQLGGGIGFWMYDGHQLEMDEEYAFSLMDSEEEWESVYGDSDEDSSKSPAGTS